MRMEARMVPHESVSRRGFLLTTLGGAAALAVGATPEKPVVSVVRIKNDKIAAAVEEALDLLGGVERITKGKERILLKPNLVNPDPKSTTKIEVIAALARSLKAAHKDVSIGEGSAAAEGFNA